MNKEFMPKVSIIIPVYNGHIYMKEAIDSAVNQTYKNIEIVVVNDGSNDNGKTDKIALSYGNKIKYISKENGGVSTALNTAIKNSDGEYISWLSHDDVYYHNKIEEQIKFLEKFNNKEKVIIYGDYDLIDENSKLIDKAIKDHKMLEEKPEYALLRGTINGITLLIPRKAFDDCGLFDENLRCTQDYELWQRMNKKYKFIHMEGIYSKSRQHSKQVSVTNPKVIIEGDELWVNLVEDITDEAKVKLEGSIYGYYSEMVNFFKDTPYEKTRIFCENKIDKIKQDVIKDVDNIKVSVIIPFYNRKDLLKNSLESVLNQTHKNIEILLVDDGSKEDMTDIVEISNKDKRIQYVKLEKNIGAAAARNVGMKQAIGEYIAFLDSDDLFKENKIRDQLIEMLLVNSGVSHTSYMRRGISNETIIESGILNGKVIPKIIYSCGIATPTVMIKREVITKNNYYFNEKLIIGEDICFWLELLRNNSLLGINKDWTIVNTNENSAAYNVEKQIIGLKTILTYILNDNEYSKYDYEISLLSLSYINIVAQKFEKYNYENFNCPKCEKMLNSTSWKITKPIRILKIALKNIKSEGIYKTLRKIVSKITS